MKYSLIPLLVLCFISACAQNKVDSKNQTVVFNEVNVIPMDRDIVLSDQVVVVTDGKITEIGKKGTVKYPGNALIVEGKGKYLFPGLAEMHAHVPPVDDMEPMKETLKLFAFHGVTTIRGMLGHPLHLELRNQLNKGELLGPKFYTSGPSFNGSSVKTADQGAKMVRDQHQAGYDFLKLHPGLVPETFKAIAETANELNFPFAGHVSYKVGIWRAIDAGYATIDHLDGFVESLVPGIENIPEENAGLFGMYIGDRVDTTRIDTLMQALKKNNIWIVPTQALAERWMSPELSIEELADAPEMKYMTANQESNWINAKKSMMENPRFNKEQVVRYVNLRRMLIKKCNDQGVGLLLGCDAPQVFNVPGPSTHHELEYLVQSGLTPYEALKTGTVNVGKFYKQENTHGVIKKGADSDLILVSANPLENITNTRKIEGVMLGNQWLPASYIAAELKKLEKQ